MSGSANKNNLVYPELSYKLMGVLFKVHNKLGPKRQEKYYQRAIELELKKQGISFKREKLVPLEYDGESMGRYFIDFVIEEKIALEVKSVEFFKRDFTAQVLGYLDVENLKLGIIANFNGNRLCYKRFINPKVKID